MERASVADHLSATETSPSLLHFFPLVHHILCTDQRVEVPTRAGLHGLHDLGPLTPRGPAALKVAATGSTVATDDRVKRWAPRQPAETDGVSLPSRGQTYLCGDSLPVSFRRGPPTLLNLLASSAHSFLPGRPFRHLTDLLINVGVVCCVTLDRRNTSRGRPH